MSSRASASEHPGLARLVWALVTLVVGAAFLGWVFREPIEALALPFVVRLGAWGLFAMVLVLDAIPGTTHEPVLLLAYSGGLGFWTVFAYAAAASVLSGPLGFTFGRWLGRSRHVERILDRYKVTDFFRRYGGRAVALAAIIPFPFAVATWGAGAAGMRLTPLLLGSLVRIPKVFFYLSLIAYGWSWGA